jgi:hypothetical protein
VRCYGEHVEKHKENLRNLIGTYWELKRNIVGTQGNMKKNSFSPTQETLKPIKARHIEYMLGPSHWGHENSLHKGVCHHFWPGVIYPLQRIPYLPIGEGRSNGLEAHPLSITQLYNSEEEQEKRAFFGRPGEDSFELKVF